MITVCIVLNETHDISWKVVYFSVLTCFLLKVRKWKWEGGGQKVKGRDASDSECDEIEIYIKDIDLFLWRNRFEG